MFYVLNRLKGLQGISLMKTYVRHCSYRNTNTPHPLGLRETNVSIKQKSKSKTSKIRKNVKILNNILAQQIYITSQLQKNRI